MTGADIDIIENVGEADWEFLLGMLHRAFAYMDGRIDPPSSLHRLTVEGLREKAHVENLVLAVQSGTIVGCMFCRTEGDLLYIGKVAVDDGQQGRGIGRRLIDHAFLMARRDWLKGLELQTRIELTQNHRFFRKAGFERVGEDSHEGFDRPTSIRMRAIVATEAREVLKETVSTPPR